MVPKCCQVDSSVAAPHAPQNQMQNSVGNNTELEKKKSVDYYLTIIFPPLNHLTPQHVSMVEEKLNLCEHFLKRKLASCVSLSLSFF